MCNIVVEQLLNRSNRSSTRSANNMKAGNNINRQTDKAANNRLSRVIVIIPTCLSSGMATDSCCCGCLNLSQACYMIAWAELLLLALFIPPSVFFVLSDGDVFYTHELMGKGFEIGVISAIFIGTTCLAVVCMVAAVRWKIQGLLIPHILQQMCTIVCLLAMIAMIVQRIQSNAAWDSDFYIRTPSAVVLITFMAFPTLLELWWLKVILYALIHFDLLADPCAVPALDGYNKENGSILTEEKDSSVC